jgi:hypothetical protein
MTLRLVNPRFILVLCALVLLIGVWETSVVWLWDDAYMFSRYAHNILNNGAIAWNPDGAPTYGATSLLYLAVVTFFTALLPPADPALVLRLSAFLSMAAFFALLGGWLWQSLRVYAAPVRRFVFSLGCIAFALTSDYLILLGQSGMDTGVGLALLTLYLWGVWRWQAGLGNQRELIGTGILGGLLFSARPDLMLFSALIPLLLLLTEKRRQAFLLGAVSLAILLAQLGAAWLYFGHPLPLPFYAKQNSPSLTDFVGSLAFGYAIFYLLQTLPFWLTLSVLGGGRLLRRPWPRLGAYTLTLMGAGLAYLLYHLFWVAPIMGCQARFYQPLTPLLVYFTAHALAGRLDKVRFAAWQGLGAGIVTAGLILLGLWCGGRLLAPRSADTLAYFGGSCNLYLRGEGADVRGKMPTSQSLAPHATIWRGLDRVALLPAPLSVATTEIGLPSALNPEHVYIDLVGLNNPDFLTEDFSADWLFRQAPDLIYMPHPHYQSMNAALLADPRLERDYLHYPLLLAAGLPTDDPQAWSVESSLGVAIRRDSPHFEALKAIMDAATATLTSLDSSNLKEG